jgi:hypothetical protein
MLTQITGRKVLEAPKPEHSKSNETPGSSDNQVKTKVLEQTNVSLDQASTVAQKFYLFQLE